MIPWTPEEEEAFERPSPRFFDREGLKKVVKDHEEFLKTRCWIWPGMFPGQSLPLEPTPPLEPCAACEALVKNDNKPESPSRKCWRHR